MVSAPETDPRAPVTSELAAAALRRAAAPSALADVFDVMVERSGNVERVSSTWQVSRAWYAVNGDVERAATAGVYVATPRLGQKDPTLVVYVDSRARATDFNANREIYLARMAHAGWRFSEIVFKLNRRPAAEPAGPKAATRPASPDLAPLTAADAAETQVLLARLSPTLSPRLKETIQRAMSLSFRRSRSK